MSSHHKNDSQRLREIKINEAQSRIFEGNTIKTSKYNVISFLPMSLFFQFKSLFNSFFLFLAVIQSIKQISPLDPVSSIAPFGFVLLISIIREGIEDYKKATYDNIYNNSVTWCLDKDKNQFCEKFWKDVQVGNILKINKNEIVPADLILLKSSNQNGFCYLQTTSLDGETALKPRESITVTKDIDNNEIEKELNKIKGKIKIEFPNKNIYQCEGTINIQDKHKIYLSISNLILRGAILKNVDFIYGVVVYTGRDTKIMRNILNSNTLKLSNIDIKLNKIVIIILFIDVSLCIICTLIGINFMDGKIPDYKSNRLNYNYLFYYQGSFDSTTNGLQIFGAFFILLSTIIPLSIIITLEFVKGFQVIRMQIDENLKEKEDDQLKILSMKLQEDLGNISYIFTDKTGTLTKNEMEFRACSIFGRLFNDENSTNNQKEFKSKIFSQEFNVHTLLKALKEDEELDFNYSDPKLNYNNYKVIAKEFFMNLVLNHNVITEKGKEDEIIFQGSNPDEVALITAANELGFQFIERNGDNLKLKIFGEIENFHILQKFDFESSRLRSSIIVRDTNNLIKIYMKGADNVILSKINDISKQLLFDVTKEHLDKLSKIGLRTLGLSFRIIEEEEYRIWEEKYNNIKTQYIIDKSCKKQLEEAISEIEDKNILLGCTALEDKLQDEVIEDIHAFIDSGIKIWMITGDKLDTAESIGYFSKLFNEDTEVFKIRANNINDLKNRFIEIQSEMEKLENEVENLKKVENDINSVKPELKKESMRVSAHNLKIVEDFPQLIRNKSNSFTYRKSKRFSFKLESNLNNENLTLSYRNAKKDFNETVKEPLKQKLSRKNSISNERFSIRSVLNFMFDKNLLNQSLDNSIMKKIRPEDEELVNNQNKFNQVGDDGKIDLFMSVKIPDLINKENDFALNTNKIKSDAQMSSKFKRKNKRKSKTLHHLYKIYEDKLNEIEGKNEGSKDDISKNTQLNFGLILEGGAISLCLDPQVSQIFWEICRKTRSVICCRCNPSQKAEIVEFVKNSSNQITLAIGDGGNDVNMIKTANVGVGIFGKEGYQAAYSSDYAISQFKFLKTLIFFHGRFSLIRNSYFIYFFFFKNLIFTFPQVWLGIISGFSGSSLWDNWYLLGYNSFLTVTPGAVRMLYEEDIEITYLNEKNKIVFHELTPEIYKEYKNSEPFTVQKFFLVFLIGILISLAVFFITQTIYFSGYSAVDSNGMIPCFWDSSLSAFFSITIIQVYVVFHDSNIWNIYSVIFHSIQLSIYIVFIFINNTMNLGNISGIIYDIFSSPLFWLSIVITSSFIIVPFKILRNIELFFKDNIVNNLRLNNIDIHIARRQYKKKLETILKTSRFISKFKKFFLSKENKIENNFDLKMVEAVNNFREEKRKKVRSSKNLRKIQL